jgi:amino acid transporter
VSGQASPENVAARDDEHLRSLGIKPELKRTLGFLSNFAIAFAFISVSTGSFGNFGGGIALAGPAMFWMWFVICIGQFLVALVFAELASHYPVAGSVYQWSKRVSNRGLGWFTGWFYLWAQVVTVTAVAVIVAFVVGSIAVASGAGTDAVEFLNTSGPLGITTMFKFVAIVALILTTIINAYGVRLMSILNNIGVATEILGMLVFALVLLLFANVQPPDVLLSTNGAEAAQNGNIPATLLLGMFMAVFIVYGFDTAGTYGEETVDAGRQAPKGVLSSILISFLVGVIFIPAVILASPDISATMEEGALGGFPVGTIVTNAFQQDLILGITFGELYLFVILASVFVCTMAIQGAASRLMFSMSRDRHLPAGGWLGHVSPRFKTPVNATVTVGVIAALPLLVLEPFQAISVSIAATGLIYVSYFLCNAGVMWARTKGWPHASAWFSLGRWGKVINILALIWGGLMIVNIGLWNDTALFGDFGTEGRLFWNPTLNTVIKPFGQEVAGMPTWPFFETIIALILIVGTIYYVAVVRRQAADVEGEDTDQVPGSAI